MIILKQLQVILQSFALYGILSSNKISFINSETSEAAKSKKIRERIRNSTGSGVELHSTGTGVEPLSSSIDWAKDDTTLAEVLSSFIDWAKEISIGDITLAEVLSPFINWAKEISIGDNPLVELDWAGVISLERGYYCLILLITIIILVIIILGRLWGDSITVNVTSLEPVRTTENKIITQIKRILTPEVKWIISVIICLFLYYFYINRATLGIAVKRNHLFVRRRASSSPATVPFLKRLV